MERAREREGRRGEGQKDRKGKKIIVSMALRKKRRIKEIRERVMKNKRE